MCVSYMMADIYKVYELWQDPNFVNNYSFDSNNYLQCEGLVELQVDEKTYQEHMAILNKEFKVEEAPTLMKLLKTLICVDAKFVIQKESKAETGHRFRLADGQLEHRGVHVGEEVLGRLGSRLVERLAAVDPRRSLAVLLGVGDVGIALFDLGAESRFVHFLGVRNGSCQHQRCKGHPNRFFHKYGI